MTYRPILYEKHKALLLPVLAIVINATTICRNVLKYGDLNMLQVRHEFLGGNYTLGRPYSCFVASQNSYDTFKESESTDNFNELEIDLTDLYLHLCEMTFEEINHVYTYLKYK